MTEECPFCDIVAGRSEAHVVDDRGETTAFLDANPAARGHTLVVPDRHVAGITDADHGTVGTVFASASRVADAIDAALDPDGITLVQSSGAAAGQDVFHLHVHVIPRWDDDDIRFAPGRLRDSANVEVAERIREHC